MAFLNLRGRTLYRVMSLICALAFTMFGYDAGVLAGVQNTAPFLDALENPQLHSTIILPMIASSYTLGSWVMSMFVSFIGLPLGRRNCILYGNILVLIGGSIQASSHSVAQMIVGRVLCGFGIGFISCTVPTYMAEMSIKPSDRGPEVCFQCAMIISGVALSGWMTFGFTRMTNQVSWRFPIAFQTFFALFSALGMLFMPDTPRWYYVRGRMEEGDNVLAALHDLPIEDDHVQTQKKEILDVIRIEASQQPFNVVTLLWDNTELQAGRRLRISFLILAFQQLMGINLLIYYSTIIFSQVGLSVFLSSLLAAVMNTLFAAGCWFTPSTIEKGGRRRIMLWSAVILTIFMLIFVVMINLGEKKNSATQWTAVASVVAYIFCFGYGWVGIPWLYGPELAPLRYRHLGGAYGATGEWSMTFITVFAGGIALQRVGPLIWIWYLIFCAISTFYVYFYCPETSGKTLEEIDVIFMKHKVSTDQEDMKQMEGEKEISGDVKETELGGIKG